MYLLFLAWQPTVVAWEEAGEREERQVEAAVSSTETKPSIKTVAYAASLYSSSVLTCSVAAGAASAGRDARAANGSTCAWTG